MECTVTNQDFYCRGHRLQHQKQNKHGRWIPAHEKGGNEYMGKLTFKGGIHPYEGKELAKNHPIEKYLPKGDMAYLMSQHI